MTAKLRIALVGDYNANVIAHQAIPPALRLAGEALGQQVEGVWTHTSSLNNSAVQLDGIRWSLVYSRLSLREHGRGLGGDSICTRIGKAVSGDLRRVSARVA